MSTPPTLLPARVPNGRPGPPAPLWRSAARLALLAAGSILLAVGLVGAVLPGHLGLPLMVAGLIILLRTSPRARRNFIGLQRRHPRVVFPIRRLLRRDPQVAAVAWQQVLRLERMVLPRRMRAARQVRRWLAVKAGRRRARG